MSFLLNNLWIWIALAILIAAVGGFIFMSNKLLKTLVITVVASLLVLGIGFGLYFGIDTEYKQIRETMDGISVALEANDIDKVKEFISPDAEKTRTFAELQLGLVEISGAKYFDLEAEVNKSTHPPSATVTMTVVVNGKMKGGFFGDGPFGPQRVAVRAELEKRNGKWLVTDEYYISKSATDPGGGYSGTRD